MQSDCPAEFYRQLVNLDENVPQWGPKDAPKLHRHTHQTSSKGSKAPPGFRSAGVVDLSNPNDVGRSSQHAQATMGSSTVAAGAISATCYSSSAQSEGEAGVQGLTALGLDGVAHEALAADGHVHRGGRGCRRGVEVLHPRQPVSHQHLLDPGGGGCGSDGMRPQGVGVLGPRLARRAVADRRLASGEAQLAAQLSAARERSAADRAAAARANPPPAVQLPPESVGYRLLQAAGWRPGAGLGSEEQGIAAPLQAERNPGTRGIGFTRNQPGLQASQLQQQPQRQRQQQQPGVLGGATVAEIGQKRNALIAGIVDKELAGESLEAKIAHHRAAEEAAAEAARSRALQRALFAAFNDPFDNAGAATANTNPLGRPNRLTATNPLLGSDSD